MPTVNVQDSADEFPPDVKEILLRSRSEWLRLNDVQQISLQDLPISDEPVTDFGDGLFRFSRSAVFDDHEWPAVLPKKTREVPHLRYDFSRINLGSLGAEGGRVFERRVYKPHPLAEYGHYVFAHYIRYDPVDGKEPSSDDSGEYDNAESERSENEEEEEESQGEEEQDSENEEEDPVTEEELSDEPVEEESQGEEEQGSDDEQEDPINEGYGLELTIQMQIKLTIKIT